ENIDRDMGARHAQWFVNSAKTTGWLRETELVPKTQGIVSAVKETKFALDLAKRGKVPLVPHVAKDGSQARALHDIGRSQGVDGALGIVQGEHALGRIEFVQEHGTGVDAPDVHPPEVEPGVEPPPAEG